MKIHLCGMMLGLLLFFPQAHAQQKTVVFGASLFPPSAYIDDESGKCIGENVDIVTKILNHYDIAFEVVCELPARLYKLVEKAEVDFTVNVKSTRALTPYVEFVDRPLKPLYVNLYRYKNREKFNTIAAIRGFDYHGSRQKLVDKNYQFVDLPTAEAALMLFLKKRSDGLISYQSNVKHLMQQNALVFPTDVTHMTLLRVEAFYGIAKGSKHFDLLKRVINDFADKHQYEYLVEAIDQGNELGSRIKIPRPSK